MKVVVVDNFDSFTYNLVEYISDQPLDGEEIAVEVFKNTASLVEIRDADPDAILISPGPGHPKNERDVGVTMPVLRDLSPEIPTLGVCLGLEAAVYEYGGRSATRQSPSTEGFPVDHDGEGVFVGLDQGFRAGRYHSLAATEVSDDFSVTATTDHEGEGDRDGDPPPRPPDRSGAVPPRKRVDRGRPRSDPELPRLRLKGASRVRPLLPASSVSVSSVSTSSPSFVPLPPISPSTSSPASSASSTPRPREPDEVADPGDHLVDADPDRVLRAGQTEDGRGGDDPAIAREPIVRVPISS